MGIEPIEQGLNLDALIQASYKLLPYAAQRALIALAALPPDPLSFDEQAAAVVSEQQGAALRTTLLTLYERSLLTQPAANERLQLHQRIAEWAHRHGPHDVAAAQARWRAWRLSGDPATQAARAPWLQNQENAKLLLQAWLEACGEAGVNAAQWQRNFDANELRAALFHTVPTLIRFNHGKTIAPSLERVAQFFEWRGDRNAAGIAYLYCGQIAEQQADYAAAEAYGERALGLLQAADKKQGQATALDLLGRVAQIQGNYDAAEPLLHEALVLTEEVLGAEHPLTVASLNHLALLYEDQGKYDAALPFAKRALVIRKHVLGAEHIETATSLNNLAELHRKQGNYAAALPLYERALAIHERVLGAEHPDTAVSLANLAELYHSQGNYAAALPL
ncbi:MAG: tetratricopeptide repeat protein, partial [Candidatus Viridilinea halotolerans]